MGGLVAANALALAIAWYTGMPLRELMLVYWTQSMIIGASQVVRMLKLRLVPDATMPFGPTFAKIHLGVFFTIHYGIFHAVYALFLLMPGTAELGGAGSYLLCALGFAVNQAFALRSAIARDAARLPNLKRLLWLPYARILPMHVMIVSGLVFSGASALTVLLFGALKAIADLIMERAERHLV